jgi:tetratricopeptide (TPR) repeat protein
MPRSSAFLVILLWAAASAAQAAVTVIGGDFANACSRAAVVGESDLSFEALCNDALDYELLNQRDRAGTFVNRGVMRLRRLSYEDARRDFDAAVKLQSNLGEAYVNRGAAKIGLRRYAESLADLDRGIELGASEPEKAYFNRALAHEGVGDLKKAYFDYLKAAELSPDWPDPKRELARFTVSPRP